MAFDGEIMSPKNRAIGKAALTKAALTTLERLNVEALEELADHIPTMPELAAVRDRLLGADAAVAVAHRKYHAVALALSAAFDEGPEAFSGGSADDKEPPTP
jgi:hypothetical protein